MARAREPYDAGVHLVRMLQMIQRRSGRAVGVCELAAELDVSERTVKRYADALAAHVWNEEWEPVVERCLLDGRSAVRLNRTRTPIEATLYQYAAVWIAARAVGADGGSLLSDGVEDVLDQLAARTRGARDPVELLRQAFCYVPFGAKSYRPREDVLDRLMRALLASRVMTMSYARPGAAESERAVRPYTLVLYRDALYLLAADDEADSDESPKLYAVDRIRGAALCDRTFARPVGFDPRAFFSRRVGVWQTDEELEDVRLAFEPAAATVARERSWPGLVMWEELGDGRLVLHVRVHPTPELASWAMAWGDQVEVLEPAWLRERVAAELARALARYFGTLQEQRTTHQQ